MAFTHHQAVKRHCKQLSKSFSSISQDYQMQFPGLSRTEVIFQDSMVWKFE